MLAHLALKPGGNAVGEPEIVPVKPSGGYSALDLDRHLRLVPDEVYEKLAPKVLISRATFTAATGCEHMMKWHFKDVFLFLFPYGEIKVVRNRWQMTVRSENGPDKVRKPAVIIRDLTKEAGFANMGIYPAISGADELRYAFDRAFAGVRVADFHGMIAPSAKDICDRLNWRAQFKSSGENRSFALLTLVGLIKMKSVGFHLADGMVTFEQMPGTEKKPAAQKRYEVKLTLRRDIEGFKVPMVGHGWSCVNFWERPSHLRDVAFNGSLKEVPGSSIAAH
jgi:hypothetical protein